MYNHHQKEVEHDSNRCDLFSFLFRIIVGTPSPLTAETVDQKRLTNVHH